MFDCDDRGVVGPAEDLDRVGGERPAELQRVAARHDELGELDDDGDPLRLAARRRQGAPAG